MSEEDEKKIFSKNLNYYISQSGKQQKEIAKDLGYSPTTFNTWCVGKVVPNLGKIQKIADYFGIGKTDLLENKSNKNKSSYYTNSETAKVAQEIFENEELRLLFDAARDAEPEDLRTVHDLLLRMKRSEKHIDDTGC